MEMAHGWEKRRTFSPTLKLERWRIKLNLIVTSNVLCRHSSFFALSGERCWHSNAGAFVRRVVACKLIPRWMAILIIFFLLSLAPFITFTFLCLFSDEVKLKRWKKKSEVVKWQRRWTKATVNSFNLFPEVEAFLWHRYAEFESISCIRQLNIIT